MATLKHIATGRIEHLAASHRVGRGIDCALQLHSRRISADHAVIRWRVPHWEIRDLGSKNGTFVDERPLEPGVSERVSTGTRIAFGSVEDPFELVEDTPPVIVAELADGTTRYGDEDGLFLPAIDDPKLVVYQDGPGRFYARVLDSDSQQMHNSNDIRAVENLQELNLCGVRARLSLPVAPEATWSADEGPRRLAHIGLRFSVSRDEEHVQIAVLSRSGPAIALRPRAHGYLLLTLARAYLADASDPNIAEAERGWLHKPELARRIGCTGSQVNVDMHRAKEQLRREAAIVDSDALFERRPGPRMIRLAITWLAL